MELKYTKTWMFVAVVIMIVEQSLIVESKSPNKNFFKNINKGVSVDYDYGDFIRFNDLQSGMDHAFHTILDPRTGERSAEDIEPMDKSLIRLVKKQDAERRLGNLESLPSLDPWTKLLQSTHVHRPLKNVLFPRFRRSA